jgi:hypothetical protein
VETSPIQLEKENHMLSLRTMALIALGAALVVAAPAVGTSVSSSQGANPPAQIAGGDVAPPLPSLVNTRLVRAQSALASATADFDQNQPAQAVVPVGAAVSNVTKAWGAEKYIIKTTPPPPAGDGILPDGGAVGVAAYAGPEDTGFAVLSAQHDIVVTSVGMVETTNAALQKSLLSSITSAQAATETAIRYIHSIAPPPPPADAGVQPDGGAVGSTWAIVMPNLVPLLDDEIQEITGRKALNKFPAAVQTALTNAQAKAITAKNLVNQWWPPVPAD